MEKEKGSRKNQPIRTHTKRERETQRDEILPHSRQDTGGTLTPHPLLSSMQAASIVYLLDCSSSSPADKRHREETSIHQYARLVLLAPPRPASHQPASIIKALVSAPFSLFFSSSSNTTSPSPNTHLSFPSLLSSKQTPQDHFLLPRPSNYSNMGKKAAATAVNAKQNCACGRHSMGEKEACRL